MARPAMVQMAVLRGILSKIARPAPPTSLSGTTSPMSATLRLSSPPCARVSSLPTPSSTPRSRSRCTHCPPKNCPSESALVPPPRKREGSGPDDPGLCAKDLLTESSKIQCQGSRLLRRRLYRTDFARRLGAVVQGLQDHLRPRSQGACCCPIPPACMCMYRPISLTTKISPAGQDSYPYVTAVNYWLRRIRFNTFCL